MQDVSPQPRRQTPSWRAPRVGVLAAAWTGLLVWALGFVVIPLLHLADHARPHVHLPGGGAVFVGHDHHGHHDHHRHEEEEAAQEAARAGAERLVVAAAPASDEEERPEHGVGGADHLNLALWLAPALSWRLRVWEVQRAASPGWSARSLIARAIPVGAARGPPLLQT